MFTYRTHLSCVESGYQNKRTHQIVAYKNRDRYRLYPSSIINVTESSSPRSDQYIYLYVYRHC
jgi:hypothetical protein